MDTFPLIPKMEFFGILQAMKKEQSQLSLDAHECANSIPDMNKMIFAVQSLGMFQITSIKIM